MSSPRLTGRTRTTAIICAHAAALVLLAAGATCADTVRLTNGDVLTGEVVELDGSELVFDGALTGEVRIDVGDVELLETTTPVTVEYDDGRTLTGQVVEQDGTMVLREDAADGAAPAAPVVLADLAALGPVETYYRYDGELDVGINVASGNTDSALYNVSGRLEPSFGKNTIRLHGEYNRATADGDTTQSNWLAEAKYERTLTPDWYVFALNRYEADRFQDLDLRVTAAAGPGYEILHGDPTLLRVSLAPAYVHESFSSDSDRDYAALAWDLELEHAFPLFDVYHNHRITVGLTESQNVARQTSGLSWSLIGDLDLKLEYQLHWNSNPADDAEELDHRYLVKLSYDFAGDENAWWK